VFCVCPRLSLILIPFPLLSYIHYHYHCSLKVSQEAWLLCFDEFQVTDVADALILRRFFDVLWDQGMCAVCVHLAVPLCLSLSVSLSLSLCSHD